MTIGVAVNAAFTTSMKPCASAAALKLILYWSGVAVVAEYGRFAEVLPTQTEGFAPRVIVGLATIVTLMGCDPLTQPVVLLRTVIVAL